mmetsp:Transcript_18548/g.21411  ORF Transcript_18548/g.21411 Transcript_18548/m.21411 type:complete len:465 (+) Transcript_18548:125-1519(+)
MKSVIFVASLQCLHLTKASRAYPVGCSHEPPAFYDYDSYPFPPTNLPVRSHDDFALLRRLGAGKFSDVFEAVEMTQSGMERSREDEIAPGSLCVIKCLKPVSERKIKRELLVLSHASELPSLARLRAVVVPESYKNDNGKNKSDEKKDEGKMPSLVLEHAGPNSRWFSHGTGCDPSSLPSQASTGKEHNSNSHCIEEEPYHLTEYEIKYYLFHLLVALDCLHSRGIMHRDVKPRNVLINRRWPPPNVDGGSLYDDDAQPLMLIDLGLADFYLPNQRYNVRVSSRHYKAPELLLGNEYYDYGVDMWGVGCILAGLLLRREPMFRGKDNVDQLGQIVSILGKQDLLKYCDQYGIQLSKELETVVQKYHLKNNPMGIRKSWLTLLGSGTSKPLLGKNLKIEDSTCPVPSREGLHLLDKLLVYNHDERLTAREAMMHPFFDQVRDLVRKEVQTRWAKEHRIDSDLTVN